MKISAAVNWMDWSEADWRSNKGAAQDLTLGICFLIGVCWRSQYQPVDLYWYRTVCLESLML